MVILVGQREFCNEVGNLEEETSSSDAQDLLCDLGWMLREASCDTEAACNRLQRLHQYASVRGWTRVADYALAAATRAGVSHKLSQLGVFQTLDLTDTQCEETRFEHQAQISLSLLVSELNPHHLRPSLAPIQVCLLFQRACIVMPMCLVWILYWFVTKFHPRSTTLNI
jgi:hypothetical protein